jgi:hypothetical protein
MGRIDCLLFARRIVPLLRNETFGKGYEIIDVVVLLNIIVMKNYVKYSVFVTVLALLSGCSSVKMTSEEKAAKETALKEAINKREYVVDVKQMVPMKGGSKSLTSSYSLEVKGDTVVSYLPYFGEAYSIPYGGGKGLNFKARISDYKQVFDSKGKAVIELETRNEEDQYHYLVEIFPNGSSSIHVQSNNRQSISFYGTASEVIKK